MKTYFLDTSIFISAFWKKHPNFEPSFQLVSQSKKYKLITSNHALAEYYSVMTLLPIPTKIEPSLIYNLIEENIIPHVSVYHLTEKEYLHFLKQASFLQILGGNIHDYYQYQVAHKMKADVLLTWSTKDFLKFGGEIEIRTPGR